MIESGRLHSELVTLYRSTSDTFIKLSEQFLLAKVVGVKKPENNDRNEPAPSNSGRTNIFSKWLQKWLQ
jgi:hypothetical protein